MRQATQQVPVGRNVDPHAVTPEVTVLTTAICCLALWAPGLCGRGGGFVCREACTALGDPAQGNQRWRGQRTLQTTREACGQVQRTERGVIGGGPLRSRSHWRETEEDWEQIRKGPG